MPSPLISIFCVGELDPTALLVPKCKSVLVAEEGAAQICAPLDAGVLPEVEEVQIIPLYLLPPPAYVCPPKNKAGKLAFSVVISKPLCQPPSLTVLLLSKYPAPSTSRSPPTVRLPELLNVSLSPPAHCNPKVPLLLSMSHSPAELFRRILANELPLSKILQPLTCRYEAAFGIVFMPTGPPSNLNPLAPVPAAWFLK